MTMLCPNSYRGCLCSIARKRLAHPRLVGSTERYVCGTLQELGWIVVVFRHVRRYA